MHIKATVCICVAYEQHLCVQLNLFAKKTVLHDHRLFCVSQVNLKEQGQLIRQDEFLVTLRKKKCFRHIFLFQELILFSKTRKTDVGNDTYIYKQSFKVIPLYSMHFHTCIHFNVKYFHCINVSQHLSIGTASSLQQFTGTHTNIHSEL